MPTVVTIPAVRKKGEGAAAPRPPRRKVAGYARVSTEHDEQQTSYENQISYYTNYIQCREDWDFVGMYSDEGITGTNTRKRDGFNQMVKDALTGNIDLIITKSVSRFARNTVDTLVTVRKLKEAGVEVFFEKENIWTLDSKGELLITIMSSLAQEESRSISENTTWGKRRSFSEGKVTVPFARFLGYDKGEDGGLVINREQAILVRRIYSMFLQGMTYHGIKRKLEELRQPAPGGGKRWSVTTIRHILTNEKYKGDALLQKTFTVDFLTKRKKKNEGEIQQYYIEGSHEPIVSPAIFDMAQREIERRQCQKGSRYSGSKFLSGKIKCGECGSWYGCKVWHSNDKYRQVIYRCNHKYDGNGKCTTPAVSEKEIHAWFVLAVNKIYEARDEIVADLKDALSVLDYEDRYTAERTELETELEVLKTKVEALVARNASKPLNQKAFKEEYDWLIGKQGEKSKQLAELTDALEKNRSRRKKLQELIEAVLKQESLIDGFDEYLWVSLFECMVVHTHKDVRFILKDGREIRV